MNLNRRGILVVAALLAGSFCRTGTTATTTYLDRAVFNAAAGLPLVFESLEDDPIAVLSVPHTLAGSGLVVDRITGTETVEVEIADGSQPATHGTKVLSFGDALEQGDYTAVFRYGPMSAFGFDLTGFQPATFGTRGFLTSLYRNSVFVDRIFITKTTDNLPGDFYGFINPDGFDEIRFHFETNRPDNIGDHIAFDAIAFRAVPEPAAAGLLAVGAILATIRRRVRRRCR